MIRAARNDHAIQYESTRDSLADPPAGALIVLPGSAPAFVPAPVLVLGSVLPSPAPALVVALVLAPAAEQADLGLRQASEAESVLAALEDFGSDSDSEPEACPSLSQPYLPLAPLKHYSHSHS